MLRSRHARQRKAASIRGLVGTRRGEPVRDGPALSGDERRRGVAALESAHPLAGRASIGFAEVLDDKAVLLTQKFTRKEDVDPVIARRDLKNADEALAKFAGTDAEQRELISASLWAAARLELYGDPPPPTLYVAHELGHLSQELLGGAAADDETEVS